MAKDNPARRLAKGLEDAVAYAEGKPYKGKNYQDSLLESLTDANEAAAYLNAALEDDNTEVFLLALRNVADARVGGMSNLAQASGLNRESLYRILSENGNPELNSLSRLLQAPGLKLAVETDETVA